MNTTDTDALTERIARALAAQDGFGPEHPDHEVVTGEWSSAAGAVLPIIAVEVRKAKAEAWDDCERSLFRWFNDPFAGGAPRNPYRETGDSDEHR